MPDGAEHPFAQKMISHFDKLQTPLRSIHRYPGLADQERRFLGAAWSSVTARSLWDLWCDDLFLSSDQRLALEGVEPFDEWEEFFLFTSHYFLLVAINTSPSTGSRPSSLGHLRDLDHLRLAAESVEGSMTLNCEAFRSTHRSRFGAVASLSPYSFGYHGGLGVQTRLSKMQVFVLSERDSSDFFKSTTLKEQCKRLESIGPRMCHTITCLGLDFLVAGGRASPDHAFRDCWLSTKGHWERVDDLPNALYRHCATAVALEHMSAPADNALLIYGGKTGNGRVSNQWLLWRKGFGWISLPVMGDSLKPRFGAVMRETGFRRGILLGGMTSDGKILPEAYEWTISGNRSNLNISLSPMKFSRLDGPSVLARLGASLTDSMFGILLVGGISSTLIPQSMDVLRIFREIIDKDQRITWNWAPVHIRITGQRPLLVGHNTYVSSDTVAICGGGAVCFSFGTFWNETVFSISKSDQSPKRLLELGPQESDRLLEQGSTACSFQTSPMGGIVSRDDQVRSSQDFDKIVNDRRPIIMGDLNLGQCLRDWTLPNLIAKVGGDTAIVVHEASGKGLLDFQTKNFKYVKKPFKDFVYEISQGSPQYLRSLSTENPVEHPADINADFPELASDFKLPPQLEIVQQKMHSSVLRISGPVKMWLHYDVMANVLCQIYGTKRLLLFPPSDVSLFAIPPGTSSSSINCFDPESSRNPPFTLAHPHEAVLQPGDVLFIPPLWLHTTSPVDDISISVNVFFRNIDAGYAPGRDVYGNRDLQAYEKGRRDIEKISRSFDKLPIEMGKFYLERLADELKEKAEKYGS